MPDRAFPRIESAGLTQNLEAEQPHQQHPPEQQKSQKQRNYDRNRFDFGTERKSDFSGCVIRIDANVALG